MSKMRIRIEGGNKKLRKSVADAVSYSMIMWTHGSYENYDHTFDGYQEGTDHVYSLKLNESWKLELIAQSGGWRPLNDVESETLTKESSDE